MRCGIAQECLVPGLPELELARGDAGDDGGTLLPIFGVVAKGRGDLSSVSVRLNMKGRNLPCHPGFSFRVRA